MKKLPDFPTITPAKYAPALSSENVSTHKKLTQKYFDTYPDSKSAFHYGGAVLHKIWWDGITSTAEERVVEKSTALRYLGLSEDSLFDTILKAAKELEGSGWVYLDKDGNSKKIANHTLPSDPDSIVILIDFWEHSTSDYAFDKEKYLKAVLPLINWSVAKQRIEKASK
jgi:superoxide dismutase